MRYVLLAPFLLIGVVAVGVVLACVMACIIINIACTEVHHAWYRRFTRQEV